ncbi:MAG: HDOD domain-containing protein [Sedimenticola selenatireducens]|uniref:HDOD domain-containing protein n=2 Tax=Sedimenticola selenatireducens TaxID=191960 RepID=A0A2N6CR51_9GAMM|nr:MAG: HDOD domain-containing protein [Sedimenticola selenatireducens]
MTNKNGKICVMQADRESAVREILQVKHLPPLSTTAAKLLEAISDDEIDLKALAAIIEMDPGLAARIVGLANSAYFAQPSPVYSVEEAIIRVLGLNMVKSLALGISVAGAFNLEKCPVFDLPGYWYKALACGQLVRSLAVMVPLARRPDPAALYLGGLFHNLGALLLAHVLGEAYAGALSRAVQEPAERLLDIERERLGIDHREAGAWLAERWHLPAAIVAMMGQLGDGDYSGTYQTEVDLLNCAVERMSAVRAGEAYALSECRWLNRIDGLERQRILRIEETFLGQLDDLELVARQLA